MPGRLAWGVVFQIFGLVPIHGKVVSVRGCSSMSFHE